MTRHLTATALARAAARTLVLLLALGQPAALFAAVHAGVVRLAGKPVPGATVTLTQGERRIVTTTDAQGTYQVPELPEGAWTVRVEMRGFSPQTREVTVGAEPSPEQWELTMLAAEELARDRVPAPRVVPSASAVVAAVPAAQPSDAGRAADSLPTGNRSPAPAPRAPATQPGAAAAPNLAAAPAELAPPAESSTGAADGFVIAGSVNNAATSPFAQSAAFGNFRPNTGRRRYTSSITFFGNSSALNATPYSLATTRVKPDYTSANLTATLSGPLRIPRLMRTSQQFQLQYQRTASDNASSLFGRMPTLAERTGDFSGSDTPIIDPESGMPFDGNRIPAGRLNTQAAALLGLYPLPNGDPAARINHQTPQLASTRGHSVTFSTGRSLNTWNQLSGTTTYSSSTSSSSSLFGFTNGSESSNVGVNGTWTHRVSTFMSVRTTHAFTRQATTRTPHFANRVNVSDGAGITGNDQDPRNWGPPTLRFSGSVTDLSDDTYSSSRSFTNTSSVEANWTRGRHNYTFGGQIRRNDLNLVAQENARGTFFFSGRATGSPFADFLLGLPESTSLAFGSADQQFGGWSYAAFAMDDFRVGPSLTLNVGLRWEYEAPVVEDLQRLVNLDIATGFTGAAPVLASEAIGPLTGRRYPRTLVERDILGFQPRLSLAWRPILGSSLLVRAGYDRTRSNGVAQTLARLMAQQPPLATTGNATTSEDDPLSLSNGFIVSPEVTQNTFAVDPDLRVAYAQNWQVYVQRDMPMSTTLGLTYLGTHGGRLVQQFFPNTYPVGVENPCPACPTGFRYVTSHGSSSRHAARLEIRRRTRNGLTASAQYTLAKATDNSSGFGDVGGASTAQNWLDLDAEHGPSSFDQRHLVGAQVTYSTGVGLRGGGLLGGWRGRLLRSWTIDMRMTSGSGLPVTPLYQPATALTPPMRADLTGAATEAPAGYYLNPAAYGAPAAGAWGRAGRNSGRGPRTFTLDGSVQRSFPMSGRTNLDLRLDATNLLNRVVYTGVETLIGNPQFGLPGGVGSMRRINARATVRF